MYSSPRPVPDLEQEGEAEEGGRAQPVISTRAD